MGTARGKSDGQEHLGRSGHASDASSRAPQGFRQHLGCGPAPPPGIRQHLRCDRASVPTFPAMLAMPSSGTPSIPEAPRTRRSGHFRPSRNASRGVRAPVLAFPECPACDRTGSSRLPGTCSLGTGFHFLRSEHAFADAERGATPVPIGLIARSPGSRPSRKAWAEGRTPRRGIRAPLMAMGEGARDPRG